MALDRALQAAIDSMPLTGIMVGHRVISPDDEDALMPAEAAAFAKSVTAVRRASGAARIVARELLAQAGLEGCALPKSASGAPIWPRGVVGSISHDSRVAVAAIAKRRDFSALGIDVEPAEPLPPDLLEIVATPKERLEMGGDLHQGRLLFVAKEAVYKAVHPLDQIFLDHHDVEVSFPLRRAVVRYGRIVDLRFCVSSHFLAVAFLRASGE